MKNIIIGLTGGIGCGKTEAARIFEKLGAKVIDADAIGKEVVETRPEVLHDIVNAFGTQFVDDNGTLKRKELGSFVFQDEQRKKQLNAIVHPHLWKEVLRRIETARKEGYALIIVDAALIYETGLDKHFLKVIVVSAPLEQRITRIRARDGLTEDEIRHRFEAQMPLEDKVKRADFVIENDGSLEALKASALRVFEGLKQDNLA